MQFLIDALQNYPDPAKRSQEIKIQISESLLTVPFFAEFLKEEKIKSNARHLINEFSNYLELEFFKNGDIICREGERGEKFYIILQGTVNVYRLNQDAFLYNKQDLTSEQYFSATQTKIGQVTEGNSFGELALTLNKPRFATVKASTSVWLCSLNKESFTKMTDYKHRQLNIKTTALAQIFPKISQNSLIRLAYQMQLLSYPKNHYIFRQGEQPTGFYIVSEGEIKLEQVRREKHQIFAPIMILTAGSLFGVQEIILHKTYDHNAICMSQKVSIYKFPCDSFEQFGNEFGKKALLSVTKNNRQPTRLKLAMNKEKKQQISLRDMTEEDCKSPRKTFIVKSLQYHKNLSDQIVNSEFKRRLQCQSDTVSFHHPFFSDLDADNFKQIKKIGLEKEKATDLRKYNEQFSISKYFDPIDIGKLLEPMKQIREENQSQNTQRSTAGTGRSFVAYPISGYHKNKSSRQPSLSLIKKKY